jgi:hypothetical protein
MFEDVLAFCAIIYFFGCVYFADFVIGEYRKSPNIPMSKYEYAMGISAIPFWPLILISIPLYFIYKSLRHPKWF